MRLIPRESKFFRMFSEVSQNLTQGTRLLHDILKNPANMEPRLDQLQAIEHRGDEMTHGIITALNQTFITPFSTPPGCVSGCIKSRPRPQSPLNWLQ